MVTVRVVSNEPGRETTLIVDKPTTMYVTTRTSDVKGRTRIERSFIWDEPADPEVALNVRQMIKAVVDAGEGEMRDIFKEPKSRSEGVTD